MPEVSVVVCARNEEKDIGECLKALRAQTLKPEIIVVDGHSADNTVNISKQLADKVVFDNKAGLADARNVGAKAAAGKIVAYCDADCRPLPEWTANIAKLLEDGIAASGPLVAYDGGLKLRWSFRIWADLVPRFLGKIGFNNLWGANMAFRRDVLLANPFSVRFIEDYEIGCRLRNIGKVRFSKLMAIPASTRRFAKSFYWTCFKYYIVGAIKIKLGRPDSGYYSAS